MVADLSTNPKRAVWLRLFAYAKPYTLRLLIGTCFGILFGGSSAGLLPVLQKNLCWRAGNNHFALHPSFLTAALLPLLPAVGGVVSSPSRYMIEWVGKRVV